MTLKLIHTENKVKDFCPIFSVHYKMHQLAREVAYGKRGKIKARNFQEQKNTCSCLTLILACIIYWQAREIKRVIDESDPKAEKINLKLLEHISPIGWDNILIYGEYIINKNLIR